MRLTEKTLELNITHEIIDNADYLWNALWHIALTQDSTNINLRPPNVYASGLSLRQEEKDGYDVRIEIPSDYMPAPRIAFLQFKLGRQYSYSNLPGTKFGRLSGNNPHITFSINNNSLRNQHMNLLKCAAGSGFPESGIYVFPIYNNEQEVRKFLRSLCLRTIFVSALDIDKNCLSGPINEGEIHHIAVGKVNLTPREVRSSPHVVTAENRFGTLMGDIIASRSYRALLLWHDHFQENKLTKDASESIFRAIIFRLGSYLRLPAHYVNEIVQIELSDIEQNALDTKSTEFEKHINEVFIAENDTEEFMSVLLYGFQNDVDRRAKIMSQIVRASADIWTDFRTGAWIERNPVEPIPSLMARTSESYLGFKKQAITKDSASHEVSSTLNYQIF